MMNPAWPALPLDDWRATYETLHLWMQIVGKVTLSLTPRTNHFWNIAFRVTARGIETPLLIAGDRRLMMTFDFLRHELLIATADDREERIPLEPTSVAAFYASVMEALARLGVAPRIWPMSVELPENIRLDTDERHHSYDPAAAQTCWRAMLAMQPSFERFRAGFIGKCSPVHFFWGAFDLAVTRFNGEPAPERSETDPVMKRIMEEAYSHAVISHGFWPGSGPIQEPAFYAYAAPEPDGFKAAVAEPSAAFYSTDLNEFVLPYEAVRTAPDPDAALTAFLQSTYDAAADLARWNRAALER